MGFEIGATDSRLLRGLSDLKTGALLYIIADLVILVGLIAVAGTVFSLLGQMAPGIGQAPPPVAPGEVLTGLIGSLILLGVAAIIGIILFFVSLYKFYSATGHLKEHEPSRLRIGRTGIILILVGIGLVLLLVVAFIAILLSSMGSFSPGAQPGPGVVFQFLGAIVGLVLGLFVAVILIIIGQILFGIMLVRLPEIEGVDENFKYGGILLIIGVVLGLIPEPTLAIISSILTLVAMILIYLAAKNSIANLSAAVSPAGGEPSVH